MSSVPTGLSSFTARVRHAEPVMGTVVSFDVPVTARHDGSLDAAVRWLHWVDGVFSPYRPDSEVSRLADGKVTVGDCVPEMAEVIEACDFVRELSDGYFTASPWGRFDPSGYVKGWAVERASDILSAAGSASHVVNGGGDVQCVGGRPGSVPADNTVPAGSTGHAGNTGPAGSTGAAADAGLTGNTVPSGDAVPAGNPAPAGHPAGNLTGNTAPAWRVGIADPFRRGRLALVVEARDCGVATSGTAERGAHIVNPRTGGAAAGLASVTVVGAGLALVDACATAAFAMGPDLARDWAESLDGCEAYAITTAGETWQTSGFVAYIARD